MEGDGDEGASESGEEEEQRSKGKVRGVVDLLDDLDLAIVIAGAESAELRKTALLRAQTHR